MSGLKELFLLFDSILPQTLTLNSILTLTPTLTPTLILSYLDTLYGSLESYASSSFLSFCLAVALADAWAAPILPTQSRASNKGVETVVLRRSSVVLPLYQSILSVAKFFSRGYKILDEDSTKDMDENSKMLLRDELRRLEQERRVNSEVPSSTSLINGKRRREHTLSLVGSTPRKGYLVNKAYQLMTLAAIALALHAYHHCCHKDR
jgi:hypothetical protein